MFPGALPITDDHNMVVSHALFERPSALSPATPSEKAEPAAMLLIAPTTLASFAEVASRWTQPTIVGCGSHRVRRLMERVAMQWPECIWVWAKAETEDRVAGCRAGAVQILEMCPSTHEELDTFCARMSTCNLVSRQQVSQLPEGAEILVVVYGEPASHRMLREWRNRQTKGVLFVMEWEAATSIEESLASFDAPFVVTTAVAPDQPSPAESYMMSL